MKRDTAGRRDGIAADELIGPESPGEFAVGPDVLDDHGARVRAPSGGGVQGQLAASEEGLQIPLMKLVDAGRVDDTLMRLIRQNVRTPARPAKPQPARPAALDARELDAAMSVPTLPPSAARANAVSRRPATSSNSASVITRGGQIRR